MSNNQELLRTTSLKGLSAARTGGLSAVEAYGPIIERIRKQCGADVATLFAEPAMPANPEPDNPQLTWYTPLDGQMVELASIDDVARRPVVARLRERLQKLKPILEDPEIGPTVASWLYIPSANDLLSVGGNPVLINWGLVPQDIAASATRREAHFAETIGRYVADMPAPPFTPQEAASYSARVTRQVRQSSSPSSATPIAAEGLAASGETGAAPPSRFRGWAPLIASLIAAAVLAFLLIPGVLIFPDNQTDRQDIERRADLLREDNKNLGERLRELESAAKERVCRLPNGQLTPLAPLPGQTPTPGPTAPNTDLLPPPPDRIQIPPSPNAPAAAPISLTELLDQAVVFVVGNVAGAPNSLGMGSGFFVTKDRIVTNRHVVEKLVPGSIKVTNKAMGHALSARVVARSSSEPSGMVRVQDFAILAVDEPGKATLKLGPSPQKGSAVIAAGYPAFLVESDPGYQRLIHNDLSAAPDNTVQSGVVIQKRESDPVKLVTHSANLGRGNSGGPLTDLCGRVVGVNTAVWNEGALSTTANLAQDVRELQSFLSANGVAPETDEAQTQCPPAVAAATPPANAPAPPAPAPAPSPAPAPNPRR